MDLNIRGKKVLITGGSNGIGKAIAYQYAEEGADIAITYSKDEAAAMRVKDMIRSYGVDSIAVQLSLNDHTSIQRAMKEVEESFSTIDILVNNAVKWLTPSTQHRTVFEEFPTEDWFGMIDSNLKGTYLVTKFVIPFMRRQKWGRIVHISSDLAVDGMPGSSPYATAKSALHGFSKTLSKELAPVGIFSNVVLPGLTLTDRAKRMFPPEFLENYAKEYPTGRLGTPEDIAKVAVFLGSDANTFVNGEMIRATGGK